MGAGHSNDEPQPVHARTPANSESDPTPTNPAWRTMTDEQFLADCTFDAFRASGPGGQKRNKTSSAVRLTHRPTRLAATASESRSQHDNKRAALRRLRHRVVLHRRHPVDLSTTSAPIDLTVSLRAAEYLATAGHVLDVLAATGWSVSAAAKALGASTAPLIRFLQRDETFLAHANASRVALGLKPLGAG